MRVLALETTERIGSIAALDAEQVLADRQLPAEQRSAESLIPQIADLLESVNWKPRDVGLVAVTSGPGSFTGLRVGATAAKTFAYAAGAKLLGVGTLEVIAAQATGEHASLWAVLDAQRGEVFAQRFARNPEGDPEPLGDVAILAADKWLALLRKGDSISGPIFRRLRDRLPPEITVVDESLWAPKAATVGMLAAKAYRRGERSDFFQFVPDYGRQSAAEEKRQRQSRSNR